MAVIGYVLLVFLVIALIFVIRRVRRAFQQDKVLESFLADPVSAFLTIHQEMMSRLKARGFGEEWSTELASFMYCVAKHSREFVLGSNGELENVLPIVISMPAMSDSYRSGSFHRSMFYDEIFSGRKAYGFWSLREIAPSLLSHPILRCCVAFGDMLFNPDCLDSYPPDSLNMDSISNMQDFSLFMERELIPMTRAFCTAISGDDTDKLAYIRSPK